MRLIPTEGLTIILEITSALARLPPVPHLIQVYVVKQATRVTNLNYQSTCQDTTDCTQRGIVLNRATDTYNTKEHNAQTGKQQYLCQALSFFAFFSAVTN